MTNKNKNSELEIVRLVESNFKFYPDDWPALKKITEESLCFMFLRRIKCVDASAYVIGHGILAGTYLAEYRDSLK